ncbi:MAG: SPASM domain-containing protein [Firmicutes bacterium]|nr:SPASM domain-containing protein [Bacillota bacterium]
MENPSSLKKIEIWLNDDPKFDYWYAYTPNKGRTTTGETVEKTVALMNKSTMASEVKLDFIGADSHESQNIIANICAETKSEFGSNAKTSYRIISAGKNIDKVSSLLNSGELSSRSSLTPMDPTDAWWYSVTDNKTDKSEFHYDGAPYRLFISSEQPSVIDRVEALIEQGKESILLIPVLTTKCLRSDAVNFRTSMKDFGDALLAGIKERRFLPVFNAEQMFYLIHRFYENNPVKLKNRCNNTDERVLLDSDGSFRPCRHYDVYPKYNLGNIEDGIYHKRRVSLHRYGLVMRNGCNRCSARFYCAGPCPSVASVYMENYIRPMGYHCLFTVLLQETIEYVYNKLRFEDSDSLIWALDHVKSLFKGIYE